MVGIRDEILNVVDLARRLTTAIDEELKRREKKMKLFWKKKDDEDWT